MTEAEVKSEWAANRESQSGLAGVPPSSRDGRAVRWALAGTLALTLFTVALTLARRYWPGLVAFHAEWPTWLLLVQTVGLIALFRYFGRLKTIRGWLYLGLLNGWLVVVAGLLLYGTVELALLVAAHVLVRLVVAGSWVIACLGAPCTVFWLWRHRRAPRPAWQFGRLWFSSLVLLASAEPLASILEENVAPHERDNAPVAFPSRLADPPAEQLRIVSLGGSTMFGSPYDLKFGIPQVVAWRLRQMYPRHKVISQNLALPGLSLRQALDRLHSLDYRPHLLLIYSGHNEFFHELEDFVGAYESPFGAADRWLELSPMFRILNLRLRKNVILQSVKSSAAREFVERPLSPPEVTERRRQRFGKHLEELAQFGRSQGIAMLWFVPAGSESGFEPNRSFVAPDTPLSEIAGLHDDLRQALEWERAADWAAAAEMYRAGLARHPEFAEFHFRLGECLLQLGDISEARGHFEQALDLDGHPVRLTGPFQKTVAEVASACAIPLVFSSDVLRPHTPFGILDRTVINDNVHPTLRGYYELGVAGADVVRTSGILEPAFGPPAEVPSPRLADAIEAMRIDRSDIARALRRTASAFRLLARMRYDEARRLAEADRCQRLADRLDTGEIEPGEEGTEALR